jgi:AcrR family transcriptional regulator
MMERGEHQKRDELIEAAVELFAANGYAGTSIRDIAKITGRSVSNVYHYFKDKESLWLAILEYSVQGMPARLRAAVEGDAGPRERFARLIRAHLEESVRHRREAKIFFIDEERLSPVGKRINKRIQKEILDIYLDELKRLGTQVPLHEGNLRVLAFNVLGVINWHLRWQDHVPGISPAEVQEQIVEFVLNGVLGAHARVPGDPAGSS